jgi:hypothetical protein
MRYAMLCQILVLFCLAWATPTWAQDQIDDSIVERVRYRPKNYKEKLTPYDLNKEFEENKKLQAANKGYSGASFALKEFSEKFYPNVAFQWYDSNDNYIGIRKKDKDTIQAVYYKFYYLCDGLRLIHYNGELEMTTKADRFVMIPNAAVTKEIKKNLLERKWIRDNRDIDDVFVYRVRTMETESKSSNFKFPDEKFEVIQYGIQVINSTYLFNENGRPVE